MKRVFDTMLDSQNCISMPAELIKALGIEQGTVLKMIDAGDAIIVLKEEVLKQYFNKK